MATMILIHGKLHPIPSEWENPTLKNGTFETEPHPIPGQPDIPKYLGSVDVPVSQSPYKDYTGADWILHFLTAYGQSGGAHHKAWVLDQIARITLGSEIKVGKRTWANGHVEWDASLMTDDHPSLAKYHAWVKDICFEDGDPQAYGYDVGVPP